MRPTRQRSAPRRKRGAEKCRSVSRSKQKNASDDWQSIYGWRGSSPDYFLRYETHFPSHRVERLFLRENFRSRQSVIDAAEKVLRRVTDKIEKHGIATRPDDGPIPAVRVIAGDIQSALGAIVEHAREYCAAAQRDALDDKFCLQILARTNKDLNAVEQHLRRALGDVSRVQFLSIHQSKGLEAPYVIVLGDCSYSQNQPLKNLAYAIAVIPGSYDRSQRDEAFRLAYVALTRAKLGASWFGEVKDGGAMSLLLGR